MSKRKAKNDFDVLEDDESPKPVNKKVKREKKERPQFSKPAPFNYESEIVPYKRDVNRGNQSWTPEQLLSEQEKIPLDLAASIISLFQQDNSIPFLCRYRKDLIRNKSPAEMISLKLSYDNILNLEAKADKYIKQIMKENQIDNEIEFSLRRAKTIDELDTIYAPYKPASKGSLYERAKQLGLEPSAERILDGARIFSLSSLVNSKVAGLETEKDVKEGIKNILIHVLTKNSDVLLKIRLLKSQYKITFTTIQTKSAKTSSSKVTINKNVDDFKYENYFDFSIATVHIKSHQVLAINRGENSKVLTVKLILDNRVERDLYQHVNQLILSQGLQSKLRTELFKEAFDEAFAKKIGPLICRQERSDLTKKAEKESIKSFASNLKQLLLTSPNKGEKILSLDPGFKNGCKYALISEQGDVIETGVVYPHSQQARANEFGHKIAILMKKYGCSLIALGNGTACRETEAWITKLMENNVLDKSKVRYCIVSEQGASIYSCSEIAKKEFPRMDVNLISAVSIARRLNDPLCEYVKVEPRNLGIGMYQHDINPKDLNDTLDQVVIECVSFVGVDLNTASSTLLSRVAGLSVKKAEMILQHRAENGTFKSRKDLLNVKGIGPKIFAQCAGFVRIEHSTAGGDNYNILDATWIHPESYKTAEKIIKSCGLSKEQFGKPEFIKQIQNFRKSIPIETMSVIYGEPNERLTEILNALERELLQDYRVDVDNKPLFKQGLTKMSDLKVGSVVNGSVLNVVAFGCFVDIGVHINGLIHSSKMNNQKLSLGDKVEAVVLNIDEDKKKIGLKLLKVL